MIQLIANKYAQNEYQDVVVGIQLLNEPLAESLPGGTDAVVHFYKDGYGDVRRISDTPCILHDAFQNGTFWNNVLNEPDASNGKFLFRSDYHFRLTSDSRNRYSPVSSILHGRTQAYTGRAQTICL